MDVCIYCPTILSIFNRAYKAYNYSLYSRSMCVDVTLCICVCVGNGNKISLEMIYFGLIATLVNNILCSTAMKMKHRT